MSFTSHLKELLSCYSVVHQFNCYYRTGYLDGCSRKWSSLFKCLMGKIRSSSVLEEIQETREKAQPHIWTFRTPEEASTHWNNLIAERRKDMRKMFGYLNNSPRYLDNRPSKIGRKGKRQKNTNM